MFAVWLGNGLNDKGIDGDLIEKCLAHKERNDIRHAYNRSTRLPEREKHMQWWADWLDALQAENVIVGKFKKAV